MEHLDLPAVEIGLDERLGWGLEVGRDQVGGVTVEHSARSTGATMGRGRKDQQTQRAASSSCLPEHVGELLVADRAPVATVVTDDRLIGSIRVRTDCFWSRQPVAVDAPSSRGRRGEENDVLARAAEQVDPVGQMTKDPSIRVAAIDNPQELSGPSTKRIGLARSVTSASTPFIGSDIASLTRWYASTSAAVARRPGFLADGASLKSIEIARAPWPVLYRGSASATCTQRNPYLKLRWNGGDSASRSQRAALITRLRFLMEVSSTSAAMKPVSGRWGSAVASTPKKSSSAFHGDRENAR